jgi:peptidyl-prolyl cis-trans isomerase C
MFGRKTLRSVKGILFMTGVLLVMGGVAQAAKMAKDTVAVVNGVAIKQKDLDRSVDQTRRRFVQMGRKLEGKELKNVKDKVLDTLIDRELLYQESEKEGINIHKAEVDKEIKGLQKKFSDKKAFANALKAVNLSEAELEDQIKHQLAIKELIDKKIASKVKITNKEAKAFYDKHPEYFKQPEEVRASHILVKVPSDADKKKVADAKKKMEAVQTRLKKGEDFSKVAKEVSEGPSSKKGGDLGFFKRGQMVKPFEDAAFALKPGQTSDIIRTRYGFHIIKVTDKKPASVTPFKDVEDKIKTYLKQKKVQEDVQVLVANLKKKAKIEKITMTGK